MSARPLHTEPLLTFLRDLLVDVVSEALRQVLVPQLAPPAAAPSPQAEEYLSTAQAAAIAGVQAATVRRWMKRGLLPRHRAGRLERVRRDELHAYLARVSTPTDGGIDVDAKADAILNRGSTGKRSQAARRRGV
jgi:excisionase family DNA binding protein